MSQQPYQVNFGLYTRDKRHWFMQAFGGQSPIQRHQRGVQYIQIKEYQAIQTKVAELKEKFWSIYSTACDTGYFEDKKNITKKTALERLDIIEKYTKADMLEADELKKVVDSFQQFVQWFEGHVSVWKGKNPAYKGKQPSNEYIQRLLREK